MTRRAVIGCGVALAAASALPAACGGEGDEAARQALVEARARWERSGSATYVLWQRRACFCTPEDSAPVIVRVQDGRVAEVLWADPTMAGEPVRPDLPTVAGLFRAVADGIEDAHALEVDYDAALGYPTRPAIDPSLEIYDDETTYLTQLLTVPGAALGDRVQAPGG